MSAVPDPRILMSALGDCHDEVFHETKPDPARKRNAFPFSAGIVAVEISRPANPSPWLGRRKNGSREHAPRKQESVSEAE